MRYEFSAPLASSGLGSWPQSSAALPKRYCEPIAGSKPSVPYLKNAHPPTASRNARLWRELFLNAYLRWTRAAIASVLGIGLIFYQAEAFAAKVPGEDLFADGRVIAMEVEVAASDMEDLARTQKFKGMGERKSYVVTVREGEKTYPRVAMHLKGAIGSFRSIDKNPALTLNFDKHVPAQRFHGLKKISLNNSVQDSALVSERFTRELFRRAGIPSPRAGFATVKLNGRDLGVYILVEGYNRQFLKQHFDNTEGNLYDCGLAQEIDTDGQQPVNTGQNPRDQAHLKQLIEAAREPEFATRLARLERVLDVEHFVTLTALDVMLVNWDGYALNRNNYRMFHDTKSDRLIFLPHGLDQTFQNPEFNLLPRMPGLVARALLETPEGRRRYLDRVAQLTDQLFYRNALTNRIQQIAAAPQRELAARDAKLAGEHRTAVAKYCESVERRVASVGRQLVGARQPLRFNADGVANLSGWAPSVEFGRPNFGATNATTGPLMISADRGHVIAGWQIKVWLEKGRYRFEGRMKTSGLVAGEGDTRGGAGLRPGSRRLNERALGDQDWKPARFEFEVFDPLYEMPLVCEVRAARGEVEFDRESLRLVRLPAE